MVARLQIKASQIGKILETLENKNNEFSNSTDGSSNGRQTLHSNNRNKSDHHSQVHKKHYIDPIPPFNANKIRKSPSGNTMETN